MGELIQFLDLHSGSLKSNGLPRPKIRLKKFGFSLKTVPATTLFQTAFHRVFQLPSLFQIAFHCVFQLPSQTAHVRFHGRKWVHTRLSEKDRTQGLTRRNRGRFGWGRCHYPRSVPHVHEHPRAGYQNGKLCRFGGLVKGASEERREPRNIDALMRVAVPRRRSPAGLRILMP